MSEPVKNPRPQTCAADHRASGSGIRTFLITFAVSLALAACGTNRFEKRPPAWGDRLQGTRVPAEETVVEVSGQREFVVEEPASEDPAFYKPGTDVTLRPSPQGIADARRQSDGDVKLNFQNANLLEVVKVILGDMLSVNYTVDPAVLGVASMQTTHGIPQDDLIPTLELLLRQNNAALIPMADGSYRIAPLANALAEARAPQLGDSGMSLPPGFSVRVVPLRYVSADDMAQILTPIVSGNNQLLRVDTARNLLIIAGTGHDMERLLETVSIFDVDRMAGMSVALFTPDYVEASTLVTDLEALLADPEHGLMPGLVNFTVIERLNGIIAVTSRAEHLARVRQWVRRLDRNTGDASPRLFVYRVQNGKATEIADVMNRLFNPDATGDTPEPSLAPGLEPATIGQQPINEPGATETTLANQRRDINAPPPRPAEGFDIDTARQVQIIADEPNNALLILARGADYRQILTALKQIDVSPLQVLIEVTIAEVTLSDNLSYGVEWFFKNNVGSKEGVGILDLGADGIAAIQPGFSYAILGGGDAVRFVINTLATESNLSIISSPSLLVLNNQDASIQVGQEVPVAVQQQQSTVADSNIINSIEYRDTGVLLNVKPRVNAGGLVIMEVEQEVSNIPTTNNADPLTPRIQQRKVTSTVAVNSGDTIVLGGLIQDDRDRSESGIPLLHKLPFFGALFGNKADNQKRTELIVLITPRAISNSTAALQVTEEYRRRLQKLIPSRDRTRNHPHPPRSTYPRNLRSSRESGLHAGFRAVRRPDTDRYRAYQWHLIVRREIDSPETIKYTLSNAPEPTPTHRLARMQAQRFWVERALQDGKSESGLADCQARKWSSWHHHMALVMMAMLFMLEERILQKDTHPLLSCSDIESLLRAFLPRRDVAHGEVVRQMEKRHRKRQAAIESQYRKQASRTTIDNFDARINTVKKCQKCEHLPKHEASTQASVMRTTFRTGTLQVSSVPAEIRT